MEDKVLPHEQALNLTTMLLADRAQTKLRMIDDFRTVQCSQSSFERA